MAAWLMNEWENQEQSLDKGALSLVLHCKEKASELKQRFKKFPEL